MVFEEEILSYSDVAYLILKETNNKQKIQDLFKKVIKLLDLSDNDFEDNIGTFFEQVITDKRFIMLDDGYCDLKTNHSSSFILEDDDDYELEPGEENFDDESLEDNYDDDANPNDDSEDDLQDLVILDDNEELDDSDM